MPFSIVPPPYGPGGGNVTGGGDLNNADRVVIVAGTSEVGESDVTLTTGIFSRAGTVGLAATGANVITFSTNGSERGRWSSVGDLGIGTTTPENYAGYTTLDIDHATNGGLLNIKKAGTTVGYLNGVSGITLLSSGTNPLQLTVAGAGYIALSTNASERARITSGGNLLIGTTTDDGSSKLQVAGKVAFTGSVSENAVGSAINTSATGYGFRVEGGSTDGTRYSFKVSNVSEVSLFNIYGNGTSTFYNETAVTGSTSLVVRAGAGQSTNNILTLKNNSNVDIVTANIAGANDYRLGVIGTSGSIYVGALSDIGWVFTSGASADLVLGTVGTERLRVQASDPGVKFATGTKIGFFGVTPVVRQTATDITEVIAALQAYGLLT